MKIFKMAQNLMTQYGIYTPPSSAVVSNSTVNIPPSSATLASIASIGLQYGSSVSVGVQGFPSLPQNSFDNSTLRYLFEDFGEDFNLETIFLSKYKIQVNNFNITPDAPIYKYENNVFFYYELWKTIFETSCKDYGIVLCSSHIECPISIAFSSETSKDHFDSFYDELKEKFWSDNMIMHTAHSYMPSLTSGAISGHICKKFSHTKSVTDNDRTYKYIMYGNDTEKFKQDIQLMDWVYRNCSDKFFIIDDFIIFNSITDAVTYKMRFS